MVLTLRAAAMAAGSGLLELFVASPAVPLHGAGIRGSAALDGVHGAAVLGA